MKTFDQVWDETEGKTRIHKELMCKTIILELERECDVHFPINEVSENYGGFLQVLLFNSYYMQYREKLLDIMEKYSVNWTNIVYRFISVVNQKGIPPLGKRMMENALKTLPYCKMFERIENGYVIETLDGILEIYQLSEVVRDPILWFLLNDNILTGCCHDAVKQCNDFFPHTNIVTSEIKSVFDGVFYHSYFKDEDMKEVIDISSNTIYVNSTFDTFYKPNEIQIIPSMMLDEYLKQLPENKDVKYPKVLRLALQNKMKTEEES